MYEGFMVQLSGPVLYILFHNCTCGSKVQLVSQVGPMVLTLLCDCCCCSI